MALLSDPKFNESLEKDKKSLIALDNTAKDLTKSIEATDKALDEYSQKIKENEKAMEGLDKRTKEFKNLVAQNTELEDNKQELLKQKSEQQEDKELVSKEETEVFTGLRRTLLKVSDAEMEKRKESAEQIKVARQQLKMLEKQNENGIYDQEIAIERKNIDQKEKDEATRREKQQTSIFKKGFTGLQNKFSDFGKSLKGKGITALKTGLFIAAYFALAKFLQSDAFKKMTKFIYEVIIPNLKEIGIVIGVLAGLFVAAKIVSIISGIATAFSAIKTGFLIVSGALKLGFLVPLAPIIAIVAAVGAVFMAIVKGFRDFQKTLEETGDFTKAISNAVATFTGFLIGLPFDLLLKIVGFFAGLFGFDNFKADLEKLDPIGEITKSLKVLFTNITDFFGGIFSKIKSIFKALSRGAVAVLKAVPGSIVGGESPTAAFGRVFSETMEGEEAQETAEGASAITAADVKKKIDKSPNDMVADKKSSVVQSNNTVINNTNVNNGDEVQQNYSTRTVRDGSNQYANVV